MGFKALNLPELRRTDRFVAELGDGRFVDIRSGRPAAQVVDPSRIAAALEE